MGARCHPRWIETLLEENSRAGDVIVFTDGSVVRGKKSGWGYTARVDGKTVSEDSAKRGEGTKSALRGDLRRKIISVHAWVYDF